MHRLAILALAVLVLAPAASGAAASSWTVRNPTDVSYGNEPVRLDVEVPDGPFVVETGGKPVGYQVETIDGRRWIWVATTLAPGEDATYTVKPGTPPKAEPLVRVSREGDHILLASDVLAVKVPAGGAGGAAKDQAGPVAGVRLPDGRWVGRSFWHTARRCTGLEAEVVGDGTVFGRVRLRYAFEGTAGLWGKTPSFAEVTVTLQPGTPHIIIDESHEMDPGDWWELALTDGWGADRADCQIFGGAAGKPKNEAMWPTTFEPLGWSPEALHRRYREYDPRLGDTLMWLVPRWNQHYEDGWMFLALDDRFAVGALVCRASRWFWPHNNKIAVKARESGDYAGLRCPTWKGQRHWLLVAGEKTPWETRKTVEPPKNEGDEPRVRRTCVAGDYVFRYGWRPLDIVLHEYITDWPGDAAAVGGKPAWPASINPVGMRRGFLGGSHGGYGASTRLQEMVAMQVMLHYDFFGSYWLFWSPENPNFYTSLLRGPIRSAGKFKDHPRYKELQALADSRAWEDVYHSVTLPSGAGQECPGYQSYAMGYVGGGRKGAADRFLKHLSQPLEPGRRGYHPGGDTHPPYLFGDKLAGYKAEPLPTEELQGFGVVFHHRRGTPRETYLAFKSGPNRGHYHGDSLAIHYCANAMPLAVDHHASYKRRPGQEHMHNRVAFSTPEMPYANMDGYERVIGFKTSETVDVAVGQVESERLRYRKRYPPEDWDREWPQVPLEPNLAYRRTIVFVKGDPQDFFVIRDQYAGPDLQAHYCLHVVGETAEHQGRAVDFDGLRLFVAKPDAFAFGRHDWAHTVGRYEATKGVRLSISGRTGEFITVLYPRTPKAVDQTELRLEDAVRYTLTDGRGRTKERTHDLLVTLDTDGGRLCPNAAVMIPDYGSADGRLCRATAVEGGVKLDVAALDEHREGFAKGTYTVHLSPKAPDVAGRYEGTFDGVAAAGPVSGTTHADVRSWLGRYEDSPVPEMEAVPGGVRVGETTVTFAGGIDEDPGTTYVTVTRGGKALLALAGTELDLDRFQGEIGLFVPNTGYPFGRIPDWLIRQRIKRPEETRP